MVVAIMSIFALSVCAAEYFGEVEIIDLDADGVSDIAIGDRMSNVILKDNEKGVPATEDARVTLNCTCEAGSHTFPAYYISVKQAQNNGFYFTALNGLIAEYCGNTTGFTTADVTAYEMPNGYTDMSALLFYVAESGKNVFRGTSLKYFSFAKISTDTDVPGPLTGVNWISTSPVEVVELGNYVTNYPAWFTYKCNSLTELVIPDQVKSVGNMALYNCTSLSAVKIGENSALESIGAQAFKDCDNLTAFYIPKGITSLGSSGSNQSPFDGCDKLYFINDPSETEKPEIYYVPKTLTTFIGETFKGMKALNNVMVFHENVTNIADGWAFCNTNAISIVFLGDMGNIASVSSEAWNTSITIYFCNVADKSTDDITTYAGCKMVFCNADGNSTHLFKLDSIATCTEMGGDDYACFCGELNPDVTPTPALGHIKGELVTIDYENGFLQNGYIYHKCEREGCTEAESYTIKTDEAYIFPALFIANGYSVSEEGSMMQGFVVNRDAYNEYTSKVESITFGMVAAVKDSRLGTEGGALFSAPGVKTHEKVAVVDFSSREYSIIQLVVTGLAEHADTEVFCCMYYTQGDKVYYVNEQTVSETATAQSYNQAHPVETTVSKDEE